MDTSVANAFRRIMMAEVPTVAVEEVVFSNNTSVMHDEVMAHRIGLIPIRVDPDKLRWYPFFTEPKIVNGEAQSPSTIYNTVPFRLHVKCTHKTSSSSSSKGASSTKQSASKSTNPDDLYENHKVYASDLKYSGSKEQLEKIFGGVEPQVLNPDILIVKLRPGQEIDLTAYAVLGIGSDHAKFSPVATASYRLLPLIDIISPEPITGKDALKLQTLFSPGVIGIKNNKKISNGTNSRKKNSTNNNNNEDDQSIEAYVADARRDTVSREVFRHEEFKGKVKLGRKRDHFIFNIESTGAMQPDEIFVKSIDILRNKCIDLLQYELQ